MEMIYCTLKPSTISAKFSSPKEEFQGKHNSLNGLTAGCWRKCLCSLFKEVLMIFRQGHLHCIAARWKVYWWLLSSLIQALLPLRAVAQASWLINKRLTHTYCVWGTVCNLAVYLCKTYSHITAAPVSAPSPPLLILT